MIFYFWNYLLEFKKQIQGKTYSFPRSLYFIVRHCCFLLFNYVSGRPLKHLIVIHGFLLIFGVKTRLLHCTTSSWVFHSTVYMISKLWNALHSQLAACCVALDPEMKYDEFWLCTTMNFCSFSYALPFFM